MFSRRHPYLFFVLVLSAIWIGGSILLSLTLAIVSGDSDFEFGEKVGVIEINGIILESKDILSNLKDFRENDSIQAIVIRIDSPGGAVGPSQEIYREIRKTAETKKIVASMGSVAASGGYYVAAGADGIIANPGTITGSIGVIVEYLNFQEIFKKIGLVPVVVKSGEFKDILSPVRQMTEKEEIILQDFVNKVHRQFINDIAEGRNMDAGKISAIADGRIYTGEEAKDMGLIDKLGNLEDAIEWAGRLGGIEGKISTVYPRQKAKSIFEYLIDSSLNTLLDRLRKPSVSAEYVYRPDF